MSDEITKLLEVDDYAGINKIVDRYGDDTRMAVIEAYELGKAKPVAALRNALEWAENHSHDGNAKAKLQRDIAAILKGEKP